MDTHRHCSRLVDTSNCCLPPALIIFTRPPPDRSEPGSYPFRDDADNLLILQYRQRSDPSLLSGGLFDSTCATGIPLSPCGSSKPQSSRNKSSASSATRSIALCRQL